jgi:D-alanyl-D-alanine carboxypeptidase/D-alanyl-D-alanine-endopeptidase (penicillin-binding protein 4)
MFGIYGGEHSWIKYATFRCFAILALFVCIVSYSSADTTQIFDAATAYKNINAEIAGLLPTKALNNGKLAIAVFSEKLGKYIYKRNSEMLLVPASNTKLVTTFTSYSLLGDNHVLTKVFFTGTLDGGVLNGDVYIVGGGDALLNVNDIEQIADGLRMSGIKKINGNIYGDATFFDDVTDRFRYSGDRDVVEPVAPITALSIEQNVVTVLVTSGKTVGKNVTVQLRPASSAFVISNGAVVAGAAPQKQSTKNSKNSKTKSKKKKSAALHIDRNDDMQYVGLAGDSYSVLAANKRRKRAANPVSISTSVDSLGKQHINVSGSLSPNRTYSYKIFIRRPALVVAGVLKDRLMAGGVEITGTIGEKQCPQTADVAYIFNRNLDEIAAVANKKSNNYVAETLFKLNGALANKDKNTARSAVLAELETLENNNISTAGFVFNDGSGLSRRNKINAEGLVNILYQSQHKPFAERFFASLSIAGTDGTLLKRMRQLLEECDFHGKTGTLGNVSSLSGILKTRGKDTLYIAVIYNGSGIGYAKDFESKLVMYLAEH